MKIFGSKPDPQPDPVRPDQVRRLAKAIWDKDTAGPADEAAHQSSGRPARWQARADAVLDATMRNSTDAEIRAAQQAVERGEL